jgi:AcrR family transcriptional regulator
VVQVKKQAVRDTIMDAALALFSEHGFKGTKLSDIARLAGVGVGNIYSYFPSKTHLLYSLYRPWFLDRLDNIEREAARCATPRERVRTILLGLWRDAPANNPKLANALIEALATDEPGGGKKDTLLRDAEVRLTDMLRAAMPASRHAMLDGDLIANLLLLAYDGFVVNRHLGDLRDLDRQAELMTGLLLGPAAGVAAQPIRSLNRA